MNELFPNFLTDPELYKRVEAHWANVVARTLATVDAIHPWLATTFANGTRFAQGDPIYSAYVPATDRAVEVDQFPAKSRQSELEVEFTTFGDDPEVCVLEIGCTLTAETSAIAEELISAWLVQGKSKAYVQQCAKDLAADLHRTWRAPPSTKHVRVDSSSLDFAMKLSTKDGGSSFFPKAFEFFALHDAWDSLLRSFARVDLARHVPSGRRSYLAPRGTFGLREATELSPIDTILYTALAREIGSQVEQVRVPAERGIVHSYRFNPEDGRGLWDRKWSFASFEAATKKHLEAHTTGFVAITDITDFYHQLSAESVRRGLRVAKERDDRSDAITHFIFGSHKRGLPVGPAASALFAELALTDVDDFLLAHKLNYVRYNDDFRFFCADEGDARRALELLANHLWQAHGLRLKAEKTRVRSAGQFLREHFREKTPLQRALESLGAALKTNAGGGYGPVDFERLSETNKELAVEAADALRTAVDKTHEAYVWRVGDVLRNLRVGSKPAFFAPAIDELGRLVPLARLMTQSFGRLAAANDSDRDYIREKLLDVMERATATPTPPSDYQLTWLSSLFTSPHWGNVGELKKVSDRIPPNCVAQREVLLALRDPVATKLDLKDPWHRRAKLAVLKRLGLSRANTLGRALDCAVVDWAQTHDDFTSSNGIPPTETTLRRTNGNASRTRQR